MFGGLAHFVFLLSLVIGVVLLIVWIVKSLDKKQLLPWAIGLTIIGILGMLLTISLVGGPGKFGMMNFRDDPNFQSMFEHMEEEMEEHMELDTFSE